MNYTEIQPNSVLRAYARAQLNGAWNGMAYTYFLYFLIFLPGNIFSFLDTILNSNDNTFLYLRINIQNFLDNNMPDIVPLIPVINNILSLAVLIVAGPFALGFAGFFLKRLRGEHIAVENIFDGFKHFFQSFLTMFFTILFVCLWSLLLVVPGIIKGLGYSMAFNIIYDNPGIHPLEAIKKSQIMMKGYKLKYFWLQLSFIGWIMLAALPFFLGYRLLNMGLAALPLALGFLWLYPYIYLSMANFYENLKRHQENNQETNQAVNQTENQTKPPIDLFQST
jgi:uncharacterized membrane protein